MKLPTSIFANKMLM